ncbi:MAG: hypothetical protein IIU38_04505 [Bacteroidaceae bacterium]|nr:hypothetical protein [Bacteroidaceae bacterium]
MLRVAQQRLVKIVDALCSIGILSIDVAIVNPTVVVVELGKNVVRFLLT